MCTVHDSCILDHWYVLFFFFYLANNSILRIKRTSMLGCACNFQNNMNSEIYSTCSKVYYKQTFECRYPPPLNLSAWETPLLDRARTMFHKYPVCWGKKGSISALKVVKVQKIMKEHSWYRIYCMARHIIIPET